MKALRRGWVFALAAALAAGIAVGSEQAAREQELFNQGKIHIFDRNWNAAREVFQRVVREFPQSPVAAQASYFTARCFQFEGKESEAIGAYEEFLRRYPREPVLPAEARNAVVELAAKLMEGGNQAYRDRLLSALSDANRDVRYFAAIRVSRLQDSRIASMAVPILREIVATESERDLVDRARIALLRIEPKATRAAVEVEPKPSRGEKGASRMFHLVVYRQGVSQPVVELNVPVSLAQLAVAALDESARKELRKKGVDIENVWESLQKLGPTQILTLRDGGNLIKLWIE
jgi:hypothetical protein